MSPRIQITFPALEVAASGELCSREAPGGAGLLWGILETPFVGRAVHAMYAGPAALVHIPPRHGEPRGGQIPVENETERPQPGEILLLPPPAAEEDLGGEQAASGVTLAIFYGDKGRPLTPQGWQPGVVVARVVVGLEALRGACRRLRFEGATEVTLSRQVRPGKVERALLYSDGASLGNPGPAGAGFVLTAEDGRLLAEGSIPLDPDSVNVAEYRALIAGLHEARRQGVRRLEARMDSELLCKQLTGEYRVKAPNLRPLYEWARKLIGKFEEFDCRYVPREHNARADELAGMAARRSKEQHSKDVD
ncbi:MAG: DUF3830 family protein [Armatimonadota bacterium]